MEDVTKSNEDIQNDLITKFKAAVDSDVWKKFIENATSDFEYKEGIQWTTEELAGLKKRGQPPTVENEISPIIDRLNGQFKSQRTKVIYKGRNLDAVPQENSPQQDPNQMDESHSNVLSDLALHVQQQTGYEYEEGDAFDDGVTSGFGCLEVAIDFDRDLTPKINIKAENCLNVFPDPTSKCYDWNEDAEYLCRAKWVSYNYAKEAHPEFKDLIEGYINTNPVVNASQAMEKNDPTYNFLDTAVKRIRLVEVWYKKLSVRKLAFISGQGVVELDKLKKKEISALKKIQPDFQEYKQKVTEIYVGILVGEVLVEHKKSPYDHDLFPFAPFFVKRRKNGEPYSVTRLIKSIQDSINKRGSKALHLLNSTIAIYDDAQGIDKDELRTELARPDAVIMKKKGYDFVLERNIELANAQMQLQAESKAAIPRVSGISDPSMARHSEIRSGIGLQRQQMMTDIINMHVFTNLRRTRLMVFKLVHELIKQYYTEEKVYFVLDDLKAMRHFKMTQGDLEKIREGIYDIVIEEAPSTSTIQEEQFAYLAELVKGLGLPPNIGVALLPIFMRLSQFRNKDEVAKLLDQLQQMPPERPKMTLSLVWDELYPEEKAKFAEMMGFTDLAQFEMQAQRDPKHVTNVKKDMASLEIKANSTSV